MKQLLILLVFFALVDSIAVAQSQTPSSTATTPQPAMDVIDHAVHQARRSHKPILVMFQSSWSDWCKQLDSALTFANVKSLLEKSLIITHINVLEHDGQKDSLENPGGSIMMKAFSGGETLLPFGVLFNKKGRKIADSHGTSELQAASYPTGKEQMMTIVNLVKQYVPKITPKQIQSIINYFQAHEATANPQP
jgi:thiol-disulfide isomerase/thioredoxin